MLNIDFFILENDQSQTEQSPPSSITEGDEPRQDLKKLKIARPGFFTQLWVFMKREFVLQLRMSRTLLLDQALTMLAGAVLGLLFREVSFAKGRCIRYHKW